MRVLSFNCGSSSLKFDLIELRAGITPATRVVAGEVSHFGPAASVRLKHDDSVDETAAAVQTHRDAAVLALRCLAEIGTNLGAIDAVGHRVVHGGRRFPGPVEVDESVREAIRDLAEYAPLHNLAALDVIEVAEEVLPKRIPAVAVFDTSFFFELPEVAAVYPIPWQLSERHQIRRYGFHGLAHRYVMERYQAVTGQSEAKLITLQLGSGCSAAAIRGGKPVDASMGLTPLEGLMMATRSGDVDPALPAILAAKEGRVINDVMTVLNEESGLRGVSGLSGDVRELLAAEKRRDRAAGLALDMFCYRILKYIGAYFAVLGGADAVIFSGGIGENAPELRSRCTEGLAWAGLALDGQANTSAIGVEEEIGNPGARVRCFVLPVDEASVIAQDTRRCLEARSV